jgi:translation initiation factor 2B subunit (eIF-2B alpha/beta/delta family)
MNIFDVSLAQVLSDKQSGSVAVLQQLTRAILSYLIREKNFHESLIVLKYRLPTIKASLSHFAVVNHFLCELENQINILEENPTDQELLFNFVNNYDNQWKDANKDVADLASKTLDCDGKTILLHSNSSVVSTFFRKLSNTGIFPKVIQTESRPENEGRYQARSIAELGFDVDYVVDSAAGFMMKNVDMVITGADQIHKNYFVNKIGTFVIALMCREFKVPLIVLADSRKISQIPGNPDSLNHLIRPSADIWNVAHEKIHPVNYYFEPVPSKLVSIIITEKAVIHPEEL